MLNHKTKTARANVPSLRQQSQYTCVSASTAAALQALGKTQCSEDVVNKVLGAGPLRGARWEEALAAIQYFGCRGQLMVPATLNWVKQHTDQGHPVLIAWNPEGRPWSHASCIFDVDSQYVYVMDPNCPDPNQTTRVVSHADFYKGWSEKVSDTLIVRRPAVAVTLEVDSQGRQVMAAKSIRQIKIDKPTPRDPAARARALGDAPRGGRHQERDRDYAKGRGRRQKHKNQEREADVLGADEVELRASTIRLAYSQPELRASLLPLLKTAKEFSTKEELAKYLKDHPKADKKRHKLVAPSEKAKGDGDKAKGPKDNTIPKDTPADLAKQIKDLKDSDLSVAEIIKLHREDIPEYNLTVVAGTDGKLDKEDIERAKDIATRIKAGIAKSADFCEMRPPACKGNLGITRDNMPQIMDKPIKALMLSDDDRISEHDAKAKDGKKFSDLPADKQAKEKKEWKLERKKGQAAIDAGGDPNSDKSQKDLWLDGLKSSGVKITSESVPVGKLVASQKEIKAGKSYGIAAAYLDGSFSKLPDLPILVSKDPKTGTYTVIDGHHRYAGLLAADPSKPMKVQVINASIQDALGAAFDMPGTFRADIQDNMVSMDKPLDMARKDGDTWKQSNGKWYGKKKDEAGGPFKDEDAAKAFASGTKKKDEPKGKKAHSGAPMTDLHLRQATIRLAHANPEMRPHLLPLLASTREASVKTANRNGSEILYKLIDQREFFKIWDQLRKDGDEQSAQLLRTVADYFSDRFELSNNEKDALGRLSNLKSGMGTAGLRNWIFKAANSLGMKLPSAMFASQNKVAQKPLLYREGLNKDAVRNGMGAMIYFIDSAKNHSKFYEMLITEHSDGTAALERRWGALTDSVSTGRNDSRVNEFPSVALAQRGLQKIYSAKTRKGYVDAFGARHQTPDGKKLPMGEYPVGLNRGVGFGWGTQSIAQCSPQLRQMLAQCNEALTMVDRGESTAKIVNALDAASTTLKWLVDADSTMGSKVQGMMRQITMRVRGEGRFLEDETGIQLARDLNHLTNYLEKQLSLCNR